MVLKTISPGCGVRASLMLFFSVTVNYIEQNMTGIVTVILFINLGVISENTTKNSKKKDCLKVAYCTKKNISVFPNFAK